VTACYLHYLRCFRAPIIRGDGQPSPNTLAVCFCQLQRCRNILCASSARRHMLDIKQRLCLPPAAPVQRRLAMPTRMTMQTAAALPSAAARMPSLQPATTAPRVGNTLQPSRQMAQLAQQRHVCQRNLPSATANDAFERHEAGTLHQLVWRGTSMPTLALQHNMHQSLRNLPFECYHTCRVLDFRTWTYHCRTKQMTAIPWMNSGWWQCAHTAAYYVIC
jgi:hypothetical protein